MSFKSYEIEIKLILANDFYCVFVVIIRSSDRSEEEKERDQLRHERHKERERDRRISKAAPDKR